jgi:hypothetical protein
MPKSATTKPRGDEKLSEDAPPSVFTADGRKLEDSEFVGSPSPDADADTERPPRASVAEVRRERSVQELDVVDHDGVGTDVGTALDH